MAATAACFLLAAAVMGFFAAAAALEEGEEAAGPFLAAVEVPPPPVPPPKVASKTARGRRTTGGGSGRRCCCCCCCWSTEGVQATFLGGSTSVEGPAAAPSSRRRTREAAEVEGAAPAEASGFSNAVGAPQPTQTHAGQNQSPEGGASSSRPMQEA